MVHFGCTTINVASAIEFKDKVYTCVCWLGFRLRFVSDEMQKVGSSETACIETTYLTAAVMLTCDAGAFASAQCMTQWRWSRINGAVNVCECVFLCVFHVVLLNSFIRNEFSQFRHHLSRTFIV